AGGDALTFVQKYDGVEFPQALQHLAEVAGVELTIRGQRQPQGPGRSERAAALEANAFAQDYFRRCLVHPKAGAEARAMIEKRGISQEMVETFGIGAAPNGWDGLVQSTLKAGHPVDAFAGAQLVRARDQGGGHYDVFRHRLMFPIHNERDDVIAFSGRKLREEQGGGKYINSPETLIFKKANVFFGLNKAIRHMKDYAVLCEGQLDVIACHEAGVENAVATQGTACTSEHARLLKRYTNTNKVVICYDSDSAGHDAAAKAFLELAAYGMDVRVANMPTGEDPDSLIKSSGAEPFRVLLEKSAEFFDYRLRYLAEENNLEDPGTKARVARELAPLLNALSDKNAQEASINFVATRLGLGTDGIRQAVVEAARRPSRRRERKEETIIVEPTPVDRELGVLAALALQSHEVLDFLCDQTEQLLLGSEGREGEALLRCILTARPEVPDPAGVNTFLQKQTREDRAALLALLEDPTPEDPLTAATEILGKLAEQGILRELGSLGARLKSPDLTDGEAEDIMQQITDLQRIRSEAKNP
ncbi:MAG: DNA primase, partial [Planctomycetes bacterium]|nr:DNA primase [Planctomycetota bacterium]